MDLLRLHICLLLRLLLPCLFLLLLELYPPLCLLLGLLLH